MWGNIGNFTDFAKAAGELQKQAASQMTSPSTSFGGGFFNMDSLLQQEESEKPKSQSFSTQPPPAPSQPQTHPPWSSYTSSSIPTTMSSSSSTVSNGSRDVHTSMIPRIGTTIRPPVQKLTTNMNNNATNGTTMNGGSGSNPPQLVSTVSSPSPSMKGKLKILLPIKATKLSNIPSIRSDVPSATTATTTTTTTTTGMTNDSSNGSSNTNLVAVENEENMKTGPHEIIPPSSSSPTSSSTSNFVPADEGTFEKVISTDIGESSIPSSSPVVDVTAEPDPTPVQEPEVVETNEVEDLWDLDQDLDIEDDIPQDVVLPIEEPSKENTTNSNDEDLISSSPPSSGIPDPLLSNSDPVLVSSDIADEEASSSIPIPQESQDPEGTTKAATGDPEPESMVVPSLMSALTMMEVSSTMLDRRGVENNSNNISDGGIMSIFMGATESVAPGISALAFGDTTDRSQTNNVEVATTISPLDASKTTFDTSTPSDPTNSVPTPSGNEDLIKEQFMAQLSRLEHNHESEQQQLQRQYEQKLQALELELRQSQAEHARKEEAWRLQRDSLKHELEGTEELLTAKKNDERKLQNAHLKELRAMEKQFNSKEKAEESLQSELNEREKLLEETKEELQRSRDEYATLKERVKVVAGELKERRAECRTLESEIVLLRDGNDAMREHIVQLEAQGMDLNKSSSQTTNELAALKGQLMDKDKELQTAKDAIAAEIQKGDDALAAYKRKAQQSLSVANARTASAVQAKEDAEMEARAARSTADSAMQRAIEAERKGTDALTEARAYVSEMKEQVAKLDDIKEELKATKMELEQSKAEATGNKETSEKLKCELHSSHAKYEAEQMTTRQLRMEVSEASQRSTELLDEVERLRREGKRLKEDLQRKSEETTNAKPTLKIEHVEMIPSKRSAEAEATIAMLQQELDDANLAIRELKETLKAAAEDESRSPGPSTSNGGNHDSNGGMPLFYAMEKQAELTQARNEIARLAALVGNSEASKQEAMDDMEEMRRQLEELQSKLQRESRHSTPQEERVNLEYLKHVILSFLNAKTMLEKKTLLPVIGAVLCLTPQEQQQTLQQLDQDAKISFESVKSSVLNLKWA